MIPPNMFWYLLKGHNAMGSFIWLVTFHWTTFLFINTQLRNKSILNEGCAYLYVFKLKGVQESFTFWCICQEVEMCFNNNVMWFYKLAVFFFCKHKNFWHGGLKGILEYGLSTNFAQVHCKFSLQINFALFFFLCIWSLSEKQGKERD